MKVSVHPMLLLTVAILLPSCGQPPVFERMEELRENFGKRAKQFNEAMAYAQAHDPVDSLYALARLGLDTALKVVDNKIEAYPFDRKWVAIKGDILYYHGHYREAANAFNFTVYADLDQPGYLAAQAIALTRLHQLDSALVAAKAASLINYDYCRLVGRVFEIRKEADSARFYYHWLALHDTTVYAEVYQRWKDLGSSQHPLLTHLPDSFPFGPPLPFQVTLHPVP